MSFQGSSGAYSTASSAVVTVYPFTVGIWYRDTAASSGIWRIYNSGNSNEFFRIETGNGTPSVAQGSGGLSNTAFVSSVGAASQWQFVIARFIAANNVKGAQWNAETGTIGHGSATTFSVTPSGVNTTELGRASSVLNGQMQDYWLAPLDIQAGGAQLNNDLLLQLGRFGPFSVPYIAENIVDYRSLRQDQNSDFGEEGSNATKGRSRQSHAPTGAAWTVDVGQECPYARNWVRPLDRSRIGLV